MSLQQDIAAGAAPALPAAGCPYNHGGAPQRISAKPDDISTPAVECDATGTWHIRGFDEVRAILRSSQTRQAGFRAELITSGPKLTNLPILYQEGKVHQEQRVQTARFFTPKTVSTSYQEMMHTLAGHLIAQIRPGREVDLSQLTLRMAVQVAAQVVGLTNSRPDGLGRRLESFLREPATFAPGSLLARAQRILSLGNLLQFYLRDVRPAILARRRQPQSDVISHLIGKQYSDREILIECVTYAAAGMATTREFISMAAWHLLQHPDLRARYLAAPDAERTDLLHEILRVEPIVRHLYRHATAEIVLPSGPTTVTIPPGALIDLYVYAANADAAVVGADPLAVCPGRPLQGDRIGSMLESFGDGAHRCPGAYLAIQETDIFLQRLLVLPDLRISRAPTLTWDRLTMGYELRRFMVTRDAG